MVMKEMLKSSFLPIAVLLPIQHGIALRFRLMAPPRATATMPWNLMAVMIMLPSQTVLIWVRLILLYP